MLHDGPVASASFHPDGKILATAGGLGHVYFWDAATGKRDGEPQDVADAWLVNFSPDGKLFAVATHNNSVEVWDYAKRVPVTKLGQYKRNLISYGIIASFSPDSRRLLVAIADNVVQVFDTLTGEPIGHKLTHSGGITSAGFSPDGQRVLTTSMDGTAQVWDAQTGLPAARLLRHRDSVLNAAFSPDGKLVITASRDFTAAVWDTATGALAGHVLQHADLVYKAVFSPDGTRVATASEDGTVRVWPIAATHQTATLSGNINSVSLSPNGSSLITISDDKTLKIWNWPELTPAGGDCGTVTDVEEAVFSPDSGAIWLRNSRKELQVCQYDSGEMRALLPTSAGDQKAARFTGDLRRVVTQDSEHVVRVWETATGTQFGQPIKLRESDGFDITRNSEFLFVLHEDESVEVFSVITGTAVGRPIRAQGELKSVLCSPNGQRLLMVSRDEQKNYNLVLWNAATAEVIRQVPLIDDTSLDEFTADGKRFLTSAGDYTVQVWEMSLLARVGKAMGHSYVVNTVKFSPDGNLVLTVQGPTSQVWDATTGEPIGGPLRLQENVISSEFDSDGRVFVASKNQILQRKYSADDTPSATLTRDAELATVLTLDETTGSIRMLSEDEWSKRR